MAVPRISASSCRSNPFRLLLIDGVALAFGDSPNCHGSARPPGVTFLIFFLHFSARGGKETCYCLLQLEGRVMQGGMVECPLCKGFKKIGCPTCGGGGLVKTDLEPRTARGCVNCNGLGLCTCTVCSGEGVMPVVPF